MRALVGPSGLDAGLQLGFHVRDRASVRLGLPSATSRSETHVNPPNDDLTALAGLLTTTRFGRVHEHHTSIGSTNDRALAWLSEGAVDGALVSADAQLAGRGRMGRRWSSPPGRDLYASLICRPGVPAADFGALSLAVGVGLREGLLAALPQLPGHRLALKWPNDLLLDGLKLAGVLCESRWRGRSVELVIGFGVNVHRSRAQFEPSLRDRATSLARALPDAALGRAEILAALLHALERALETFFERGFAAIRPRYEPHCLVLGRAVEIDDGRGGPRFQTTALGLDHDGALLVRGQDGQPTRVESADVWLAPP